MRGRFTSIGAAGLLVVAACGGGDSAAEITPPAQPTALEDVVDAEVLEAADLGIGRLGAGPASIAVVIAIDVGYDAGQILPGLSDGTLEPSGLITGVDPSRPPAGYIGQSSAWSDGIILAAGPGLSAFQADGRPQRGDDAREWTCGLATEFEALMSGTGATRDCDLASQGRTMIGLIVMASIGGYTGEQIFETFSIGGDVTIINPRDFGASSDGACIALFDGADYVAPAAVDLHFSSDICSAAFDEIREGGGDGDATATTAAGTTDDTAATGDIEPGVYVGAFTPLPAEFQVESYTANEILVDLTADAPRMRFRLDWVFVPGPNDISDPDIICQPTAQAQADGELSNAQLTDGAWTGELDVQTGTFDGTCSAGSQDNALESVSFAVTIQSTQTGVRGSVALEGAISLEFTASP